MIRLLPILLLASCTVDLHIDTTAIVPTKQAAVPAKPATKAVVTLKPRPIQEIISAYLSDEGVAKASSHGWIVIQSEERDEGRFYWLQRPMMAEQIQHSGER